MRGVVFGDVEAVHCDELIADHPRSPVGCGRVHASGMPAGLGSRNKEGASLMEALQPGEIQIAPIHDVESPCI